MDADLAAALKRRQIADSLTSGDDEETEPADSTEETDSTDSTEETASGKEEVTPSESAAPAATPSRREAGFLSFSDYSGTPAASATPAPSAADRIGPFTGAIAEDQPVADYVPSPAAAQSAQPTQPETAAAPVPAGHIDLGPPGRNIYTDPDTGGRYTIDPDTGQMVPHAELATAADKAAMPPGDVGLPRAVVTGAAPAPDRLTQVERGELVGLPWHPAHPEQLEDRGERGTPITPVQPAPDTLSQVEKGIALPPKVQPAQPVAQPQAPSQAAPQPPAVAHPAPAPTVQPAQGSPARQAAGFLSFSDYSQPQPQQPGTQRPAAQPAAPGQVPAEPQIDLQSQSYTKGRTQEPTKLVLHSTDGSSEQADINTLTGAEPGHRVSVNYYVTKDGRVMHFVSENDTAWHGGMDRFGGNGNAYTLGIEQQHVDGKEPWPDVQVRATAGLAAGILARHPNMTIDDVIGHNDLAGERKQDPVDYPWDKFRKYVAEAQGQPAAAGQVTAPSAQPVSKLKNGFYQDEKPNDFISGRVTTFATPEDLATGQDNGVGSPHLGTLDTTQVAGLAIPLWVLQHELGNSPTAWREARVDAVDPQTGRRLRVPIVEIGPGEGPENAGVIADMTPALARYFGGDKNLSIKIVPNAGPDVEKNRQLFYDEQAAIQSGTDTSSLDPKRQVIGPQFPTRAQTPEETAAAQQKVQQAIQKQQDTLTALQAKSTNMPDWYQTLQSPIPGVSDAMRQAVADNYKQQITKYAQDYYNEPDPDKAFARIMSAPNLLTSAGEIWTKAGANFQHAWLSIAQQADSPVQTKLIDFINAVHPEATPEARTQLINEVMSRTGKKRVDFVNDLYNHALAENPDSVKNVNMYSLLDSIDVAAQPGMQAKEAANHARVAAAVAQNVKDLREDPTMENTYGGAISNAIAQMPKNVLEAIIPVIGQSAMFSEIYTDTAAGLRKDHPDWNEDQVKAKAAAASLPQDILQELVNAATLGMGSGLTKGIANPLARIAANAIMHGGIAATAGTTQQVVANVATGRPITEGLTQAAVAAGIQGAIGGLISGRHPAEAVVRPGERASVEPPPVEPPRPIEERPPVRPAPTVLTPEQEFPSPEAQLAEQQRRRAGLTPFTPPVGPTEEVHPIDQNGQPLVSESEPWVSQIANRFTAERMASGELGPVEPGVGVSKEEMLARGLQMSPETIAQHVSNVMNDVGGNPRDQAAAIRTEEARLSQRSRQASLAFEADPKNAQLRLAANNALKDLTDFHNGPVAKLKNDWHAQGVGLQGEIPVDLSSYNGLRDAYLRDVGKAPPPEMEPALRATAKRVRDAADAESAAMRNLGAEIERQSARRRLPSDEEVRNNIMKRMGVEPCPT